ncbi:MAG: ABC transporter permease [Anaerolineae bacterium]
MRKMISVTLNDLRVFFREQGMIVGMIIMPLVVTFGVGLGLSGGGGTSQVRVDVIDNDNSAFSQQFLAEVRKVNASLVLCPVDDKDDSCGLGDDKTLTAERAVDRITNNDSLALIEIPAGFGEKVQNREAVSITYRSNENISAPSYILQAVQAAAGQMGAAQVAATVGLDVADNLDILKFKDEADKAAFQQEVYDRAAATLGEGLVKVDYTLTQQTPDQQTSGSQAGFGQSIPGMGSMFVMFTVFTALYAFIRERKNWTLQRLVMMPVSRSQILGGKILMWFLVGLLQFAVVFAVGLVLRINFGNDPIGMLAVIMAFTLCITALTFAVSTLLETEQQANSVSLLLSLTLAPLGGAWWPLDVVPEFMRTVGHLSPVAWATDSFRMLVFENATLTTVLPNIAVLLVLAVVFFAFAVWRFKYE